MNNTSQLIVIDAHAMAYRAHFALAGQNLTNSAGMPTEAVFGFFRMLFRLLSDYKPAMTVVTWDSPGLSFRGDIYKDYKAQRKPMPDDLKTQIEEIKELVRACGFASIESPGFEADDVMAALCRKFGTKHRVVLITGDKDCYQLLSDKITMVRGSKGVTEFTVIDPAWVQKELGVTVKQIPDYMALVGDSSDNIPGAKGIGPKTAAQLIQEFGSIEKIYKSIDKIKSKGLAAKLEESKDNVFLSKELAVLDKDPPEVVPFSEGDLATPDYTRNEVLQIFRQGGFQLIYRELLRVAGKSDADVASVAEKKISVKPVADTEPSEGKTTKKGKKAAAASETGSLFDTEAQPVPRSTLEATKYALIKTAADLEAMVAKLSSAKEMAVDTETDSEQPMRARLVGISFSVKEGEAYYVAIPPEGAPYSRDGIPIEEAAPHLRRLIGNPAIKKTGQNAKYDILVLRRHGIEFSGLSFDTMIASYLLNPNARRHNLDDISLDLLGHETIKFEDVVGSGRNKLTMDLLPPDRISDYACEDADITLRVAHILRERLESQDLAHINHDIELPLIPVLVDMEEAGVAIDSDYFHKMSRQFLEKLHTLEKRIYAAADQSFNINSTKELQTILFGKLGLPSGKKTKTGHSTDQSVLEDLRGKHAVVDDLLEHRKYNKLKSTYIDALPQIVHPQTGRIHTSFSQAIAATGRLSSNDPNLQNIPVREDLGRAIRRGFIPAAGNVLLSLDYSQIELRIMAHFSHDPGLIEAFQKDNLDVHARTAASVFGIPENDVTADMRSKAKVVNFSIIYGVTDYGLGQSLGIPRAEAKLYIEKFFQAYPGVRRYMDDTIAFAEANGFVKTLTGRRRQIPEIKAQNRFRREGAQRTAINTPIQGTSADIIKLAMIRIHADLAQAGLHSKMILQVHDELLFDVIPNEQDKVLEIAKGRMENAVKLDVPLRVDFRFGANWDEAH